LRRLTTLAQKAYKAETLLRVRLSIHLPPRLVAGCSSRNETMRNQTIGTSRCCLWERAVSQPGGQRGERRSSARASCFKGRPNLVLRRFCIVERNEQQPRAGLHPLASLPPTDFVWLSSFRYSALGRLRRTFRHSLTY
jgi:hypothetical protein